MECHDTIIVYTALPLYKRVLGTHAFVFTYNFFIETFHYDVGLGSLRKIGNRDDLQQYGRGI